jgi:formate dehydrogenase subunit gamma
MQTHYCRICNRILSSVVCPVHGDQQTTLVDIEPVKPQHGAPVVRTVQGDRDTLFAETEPEEFQKVPSVAPPVHVSDDTIGVQGNPPRTGGYPAEEREQQETHPHVPAHGRASESRHHVSASGPPEVLFPFEPTGGKSTPSGYSEILRFRKSERMLHWAIALPFMGCWLTSVVLFFLYNPDPGLPLRDFFAWSHRLSGICLFVLPGTAVFHGRKDFRMHVSNIKCAWLWSLNDLKWLALMGLAAISKKIVLPEQGKFNAAEKVNFMSVMVASPVFIVTGTMIWLHQLGWAAWLIHSYAALMVTPTMVGHIYMATINPDTRVGLKGMLSGYVDRQWARHHYALWYAETFASRGTTGSHVPTLFHPPDHRVRIHCPSCTGNMTVSWTWILEKIITAHSIDCPACGVTLDAINTITNTQELEWIQSHLGPAAHRLHPVNNVS